MLMLFAGVGGDDDFNKTEVKCLQPTVIVIRFKVENVCNSFCLLAYDYCCGYEKIKLNLLMPYTFKQLERERESKFFHYKTFSHPFHIF